NQARNLSVSVLADISSPQIDENVTFTITANNVSGNDSRARVTFKLPPGFEYVSHGGDGSYASADGIWSIASIGAWNTQSRVLTVVAKTIAANVVDGHKVAAAITEVVMNTSGTPTYIESDISNNVSVLTLT